MSFDDSALRGKAQGNARVLEAKNTKCGEGQITYEINWKYTTNLSGKRKFPFTGKQIEGYKSKLKNTSIQPSDIVIFRRKGHPNNGKRGEVKKIIMPMTEDEIAILGLDKRKIPNFKKVYEIHFKNIGSGPDSKEVKMVKTSKEEELQKYINHRTLICINLSKDYFEKFFLPEEKGKIKDKGLKFESKHMKNIIDMYNLKIKDLDVQKEIYAKKNELIKMRLEREKKMLFLKNKKFRPDYIYSWELKNPKPNARGNKLTTPDGTYYIMKSAIKDIQIIKESDCGKDIGKYWITVHVTLRKEAMKLGDDILLNGALFLNCAERKEKVWKIFGDFKKSSDKAMEKIGMGIAEKKKKEKVKICADVFKPISQRMDMEEGVEYEFGDIVQVKYDVDLTNIQNPWEGWIKAKVQTKRADNKYELIIIDSNISIDNIPGKYIRKLNRGGKRRKSRRKRVRKRRTRKKALRR